MKLREYFNPNRLVSGVGTNKFSLNLMKEAELTPHERMDRVLQMLENRPAIINSLRKYVNFVVNKVEFTSSDRKTVDFLNEWLKQRETGKYSLSEQIMIFSTLLAACGNSYVEPQYTDRGTFDLFYTIPDPSTIHYNLGGVNKTTGQIPDDDYWLIALPMEVRQYNGFKPKFHDVYYIRGSYFMRRKIWGTTFPKTKIIHKKIGWSRDGYYGQGFLSAAIDDDDILREIMKNWALIAKYQALGKKIIGFYNENGEPVDMGELDVIRDEFNNLAEEEHLLVNKKFVSESLSFSGENDSMDQQVEYLRKDIGSGLIPNYLTPFSQDNSLATASETKNPFLRELLGFQDVLVKFFNNLIIDNLRKEYPWLAEDATINFGQPNVYSREEEFNIVSQLYNLGAATFNELRESAGYQTVSGGDIWIQDSPLYNKELEAGNISPDKKN